MDSLKIFLRRPAGVIGLIFLISAGQRQRICIARAIALKPLVLVADEAVSALDVSVQSQILALFAELREEMNMAMIFITHDLRVAAEIADRIVVMRRGQIVEQGETQAIFESPSDPYTRALLDGFRAAACLPAPAPNCRNRQACKTAGSAVNRLVTKPSHPVGECSGTGDTGRQLHQKAVRCHARAAVLLPCDGRKPGRE